MFNTFPLTIITNTPAIKIRKSTIPQAVLYPKTYNGAISRICQKANNRGSLDPRGVCGAPGGLRLYLISYYGFRMDRHNMTEIASCSEDYLLLIIVNQKKLLHYAYENVNDKHTEYSRYR